MRALCGLEAEDLAEEGGREESMELISFCDSKSLISALDSSEVTEPMESGNVKEEIVQGGRIDCELGAFRAEKGLRGSGLADSGVRMRLRAEFGRELEGARGGRTRRNDFGFSLGDGAWEGVVRTVLAIEMEVKRYWCRVDTTVSGDGNLWLSSFEYSVVGHKRDSFACTQMNEISKEPDLG